MARRAEVANTWWSDPVAASTASLTNDTAWSISAVLRWSARLSEKNVAEARSATTSSRRRSAAVSGASADSTTSAPSASRIVAIAVVSLCSKIDSSPGVSTNVTPGSNSCAGVATRTRATPLALSGLLASLTHAASSVTATERRVPSSNSISAAVAP